MNDNATCRVVSPAGVTLAREVLSGLLPGVRDIGPPRRLGSSPRSCVARVAASESDTTVSVVVKQVQAFNDTFDASDMSPDGPADRFFSEWAAALFVGQLASVRAYFPRVLAADPRTGVLVFEDLGPAPNVGDALLGSDRVRARAALIEFARTLGRVNAATLGLAHDYGHLRASIGGGQSHTHRFAQRVRSAFASVVRRAGRLGIHTSTEAAREVESLIKTLEVPSQELALSAVEPAPDNNLLTGDGLRLIDFEGAGFRHVLLDGACIEASFPTSWCVGRIPSDVRCEAGAAFRTEVAGRCLWARDADDYATRMLHAVAAWTLLTTAWLLPTSLAYDDAPLGTTGRQLVTNRQALRFRLETFAELAAGRDDLEALAALLTTLAGSLARHWHKVVDPVPSYPAFS